MKFVQWVNYGASRAVVGGSVAAKLTDLVYVYEGFFFALRIFINFQSHYIFYIAIYTLQVKYVCLSSYDYI